MRNGFALINVLYEMAKTKKCSCDFSSAKILLELKSSNLVIMLSELKSSNLII